MSLTEATLLVLYFGTLAALSGYGLHRFHMLALYRWYGKREPARRTLPDGNAAPEELPFITLQLPVFNERYVVERLIDAAARVDYPRSRFEIQVLDDSTDETTRLVDRCVASWRSRGVDIVHLHRTNRAGYKAGALDEGLRVAKGDFIVILDADFVPASDFLRRLLEGFSDEKVGVVQARWGHLNRDFSLLTRVQAILLDGHFVIEHTARNRSGRFFNFNGTAGMWRRTCLEDAGGWEHDTLTEDLDLSYRAQLRGWRFVYLRDLVVPAELPAEVHGFKSQQHRWAKGSVQTALKLAPRVSRSTVPNKIKLEAFAHLTANFCYPLLLLLSLLLWPSLWLRTHVLDAGSVTLFDFATFGAASIAIALFYLVAERAADPVGWKRRILDLPVVLALGIGLAVNNTIAVFEALVGKESPFVRTPKHAITGTSGTWRGKAYFSRKSITSILEVALGLYLVGTMVYSCTQGLYLGTPFIALFASGFLYIGTLSFAQAIANLPIFRRRAAVEAARDGALHPAAMLA